MERLEQNIKFCLLGMFSCNYYVCFKLVFLFFKLYMSRPQFIHPILDHLRFLGSVDTGDYLVIKYFETYFEF